MGKGGRGNSCAQDRVHELRSSGISELRIRRILAHDGFSRSRVSQLMKLTRPHASSVQAVPQRQASASSRSPAQLNPRRGRELGEPTTASAFGSLKPQRGGPFEVHTSDDDDVEPADMNDTCVAADDVEPTDMEDTCVATDNDDAVVIEADDPSDAPAALDPLGTPWADARRMRAHHIVPDGNCQFRAVALAATGFQTDHHEFRQAAVDEVIGDNAHHYLPWMDEDMSVTAWRDKMRSPGSDGDHLTIHALAQIVERPIVVWRRGYWQQPAEVCHVRGMTEWPAATVIYLLLKEKRGDAQGFAKYHGHYEVLTFDPPLDQPQERARRRRRRKRVFVEDIIFISRMHYNIYWK